MSVAACGEQSASPPLVRLDVTMQGARAELRLVALGGARINARLKPTLERADGGRIAFDAPGLTADSAYFSEPPVAHVAPWRDRLVGTLRVGVCAAGESFCRSLALPVSVVLRKRAARVEVAYSSR